MKIFTKLTTLLWLASLLTVLAVMANARAAFDPEHSLVIQINKNDPELHDYVLSNINNLHKHYGVDNIQVEVVAYGPGVWMLTEQSALKQRIEALQMVDVVFTACGNTLDAIARESGERPVLLEEVEEYTAGIARIIELQEAGYAYLSP